MANFNLSALKSAASIEGLGKPAAAGPRTAKQVALSNIDEQIKLLDPKAEGRRTIWDRVVEGKRSYTGEGSHVGMLIKVGSTKLKLAGELTEVAVERAKAKDALLAVREAVEKGQMDDQLTVLDKARGDRKDKSAATRAAKKEQPKPAK